MLVLTRKEGESIIIDGDIEVYVSSIDTVRKRVSISVRAPDDVSINRKEIQNLIDNKEY